VDVVLDARRFPFRDGSIKAVFMLNTMHHIPDVELFFYELERCLVPGGRVFIIDQYSSWFSRLDHRVARCFPDLSSFVDIEIIKKKAI
jgi:ubiquinone/menaquinone biosynthesis C-methylase UbiE